MNARTLAICAFGLAVAPHGRQGQGLAEYRHFELRSDLAAVSRLAGVAPSEAKTIHERPAVFQDPEWRPTRWIGGSTSPSTDPVEQILFSLYTTSCSGSLSTTTTTGRKE